MHWGAGLGTPMEGPVPQRNLLLCFARSHPSPAAASAIWYPLCGCVWCFTHVSSLVIHTQGSDVGQGKLWASPSPCSTCISRVCGAPVPCCRLGQQTRKDALVPLLHLRGLKGLQPMAIEWPQVLTYLLHGPNRLGAHYQSLWLLQGDGCSWVILGP